MTTVELNTLTTSDVADRLKLSVSVIRDMCRAGRLDAIDVNGGTGKRPSYRIPESALETYFESNRVKRPTTSSRKKKPARRFY